MNEEIRYASPESQYEGRGEVPADTEEIFWTRMSDDYASRLKCGNLLARQYRYREAVEVYRKAERIRQDDPALYLRMGGALLTLFRFDEAAECYERARELGMEARKLAFYFGFRDYLTGNWRAAAERFRDVLPTDEENTVSAVYWHTLSSVRAGTAPDLLVEVKPDMQVGHHTAYLRALDLFRGTISVKKLRREAEEERNDLNAAILFYGLSVFREGRGDEKQAAELRRETLARESVWPCVASLAARRDEQAGKERQRK